MKKEYDFSNAEKGKFYKADAELNIPIYLEPELSRFIDEISAKKNINRTELINNMIRDNISIYKTLL